jgi:hypothetical protein
LFASQPQALPPEKISTAHLPVSVDRDIAFDLHGSWPFTVALSVCKTSKTGDSRALKTLVEFVRSLDQIPRQRYKPDVAAIRQLLFLSAALPVRTFTPKLCGVPVAQAKESDSKTHHLVREE